MTETIKNTVLNRIVELQFTIARCPTNQPKLKEKLQEKLKDLRAKYNK